MNKSPIFQITCRTQISNSDLALEYLTNVLGFNAVCEEKPDQRPIIKIYLKNYNEACQIKQLLKKLDHFEFSDFNIRILPYKRWATSWRKGLKVIRILNQLVICPSWLHSKKKASEKMIRVNPGMAFGTGHHQSTRMCLEWIAERFRDWHEVCDVGCGSGILIISAIKLGVKKGLALDIDSEAIEVAQKNARVNRVSKKINFFSGGLNRIKSLKLYDAAFANLTARTIEANWRHFKKVVKVGGLLMLAGIDEGQLEWFQPFLKAKKDWNIIDHKNEEGWHGYLLQRKK